MELVIVKLIVLALSGLVRIFFGMLPIVVIKLLTRRKGSDVWLKKVISVLMFFGGGVLLATCFLHMMPEVRDNFREAEPELELPLSEIIFVAGFFMVYILEDIVHSIVYHKKMSHHHKQHNHQQHSHNEDIITTHETSANGTNKGLPSGTATEGVIVVGDKGVLHNNSKSGSGHCDEVIINTCTSPPLSNGGAEMIPKCNGEHATNRLSPATANRNHNNASSHSHSMLSLSSLDNERRGNFTSSGGGKNGSSNDIPGLLANSRKKMMGSSGGISNGGFVPESYPSFDSDWLKDIMYHANLPRGRRSICTELLFANLLEQQKNSGGGRHNPYATVSGTTSGKKSHNHDHHRRMSGNNLQMMSQSAVTVEAENNHGGRKSVSYSTERHWSQEDESKGHSHMPVVSSDINQSIGAEIRNLLIVVAISFHGIFEGMAIGLQTSSADVWYLFLAMSLHECTILFCIGIELISSNTKFLRMVTYILIVSIVSPIGIAVGIIITERANGSGEVIHQALIIGCFQGLAAGTLVYVTFFEIFQEEGKKLDRKVFHILVAALGFILMGSLEFMGGHDHGHNPGGNGTNNSMDQNSHSHSHNDHDHDHSHHH